MGREEERKVNVRLYNRRRNIEDWRWRVRMAEVG